MREDMYKVREEFPVGQIWVGPMGIQYVVSGWGFWRDRCLILLQTMGVRNEDQELFLLLSPGKLKRKFHQTGYK